MAAIGGFPGQDNSHELAVYQGAYKQAAATMIERDKLATTYAVMEQGDHGLRYECQGVSRQHAWQIARQRQSQADMAYIPVVFRVFALVEMPDGES